MRLGARAGVVLNPPVCKRLSSGRQTRGRRRPVSTVVRQVRPSGRQVRCVEHDLAAQAAGRLASAPPSSRASQSSSAEARRQAVDPRPGRRRHGRWRRSCSRRSRPRCRRPRHAPPRASGSGRCAERPRPAPSSASIRWIVIAIAHQKRLKYSRACQASLSVGLVVASSSARLTRVKQSTSGAPNAATSTASCGSASSASPSDGGRRWRRRRYGASVAGRASRPRAQTVEAGVDLRRDVEVGVGRRFADAVLDPGRAGRPRARRTRSIAPRLSRPQITDCGASALGRKRPKPLIVGVQNAAMPRACASRPAS